jgi:beta-phosphoglucomutase-like phosphatase (HAD superfamily)
VLRAILFDFDGTILDTETPECEGWVDLYARHGQVFPREKFHDAVGRGYDPEIFEPWTYLSRAVEGRLTPEEAREAHREIFWSMLDGVGPREGVLDWLAEAQVLGWGRAVASSSPRSWIERHLPLLGMSAHFQAIRTKDDVGPGRTKPHPDLFLAACAALGVEPSQSLVVEDSENGVKAARAAGCFVVATPNPMTRHMDFSSADRVLDSLSRETLRSVAVGYGQRSVGVPGTSASARPR